MTNEYDLRFEVKRGGLDDIIVQAPIGVIRHPETGEVLFDANDRLRQRAAGGIAGRTRYVEDTMTDTIKVDDRVTWQRRDETPPYLHTMTGTVVMVWAGGTVVIHEDGDLPHRVWARHRDEVTKVGAIAAVTDDYAQLMAIGDLGGAEI